jgi:hypothetical protein
MRGIASVVASIWLAGCTTSLSVSEISRELPDKRPESLPAGFVYHLPASVITPNAYVTIRDCPLDTDAVKFLTKFSPGSARPVKEVTFVVGGSLSSVQVPDQMIIVDYRNLQKFLKTSSLTIERWPNGMLKTVNASIEDQTPQAIASVAAAAGSIALLATGAPGAGALLAAPAALAGAPGKKKTTVSFLACNGFTADLVEKRKVASASRDAATKLLDIATAAAIQLGAKPDADQAALDLLKANVAKYSTQLDKATAELVAIDAQLTLPLDMVTPTGQPTFSFPATGEVSPYLLSGGMIFTASKAKEFIDAHFEESTAEIDASRAAAFGRRPCLWSKTTGQMIPDETCSNRLSVERVLAKIGRVELMDRTLRSEDEASRDRRPATAKLVSVRNDKDGVPGADVAVNRGIIYVEPAKRRIEMTAYNIGPQSLVTPRRLIKTADISIPQLGRYLSLPVRAGFGDRSELQATFAEDGSLLTATFANPKTSGLAIADTMKALGATAVSTRDAVEDRQLKLAKTRSEMLAAIVAAQESSKKLTPTTDPLEDINAALAKANAEASLAEAQLRIQSARAKLNGS